MSKPQQTVLPGIETEHDIFRRVMRRIGAKGGKANTPKQQRTRRRNARLLNERLGRGGKGKPA